VRAVPGTSRVGVIIQPSYIPWRGYFDLVHRADVFVFYDDVQYDRRGWRNRNRIKTQAGSKWLTIPVLQHGDVPSRDELLLTDARIDWDQDWPRKHLAALHHAYHKAPFYDRYADLLGRIYALRHERLIDFTIEVTQLLAAELGITGTEFVRSSDLAVTGSRTERLVRILQQVSANHYISGPSARDYIEDAVFADAGIGLEYIGYDYPEYAQLHPPYDPAVSVLDLLFMTGPEAAEYIWGTQCAARGAS
jgi:hypothetical protein